MSSNKIKTHLFKMSDVRKDCVLFRKDYNPKNGQTFGGVLRLEKYRNTYKLRGVDSLISTFKNDRWVNVSALFKLSLENTYYGNVLIQGKKTLLLIYLDKQNHTIKVIEFPVGYYPVKKTIFNLTQKF